MTSHFWQRVRVSDRPLVSPPPAPLDFAWLIRCFGCEEGIIEEMGEKSVWGASYRHGRLCRHRSRLSLSHTRFALNQKLGFQGWGLRVAGDERGRWRAEKGVGFWVSCIWEMSRPPFVLFLSFSFILLVQLVLLIYYFKSKYPKINGNI